MRRFTLIGGLLGVTFGYWVAIWISDYWPLALPVLALIWGGFVWSAFGRDPGAKRSVKPEYAPPADLIPAQAGVLLDERAHTRDVVATIVDLAVRGYLSIEPITRTVERTAETARIERTSVEVAWNSRFMSGSLGGFIGAVSMAALCARPPRSVL